MKAVGTQRGVERDGERGIFHIGDGDEIHQ
jgi:hypothetical protein